MVIISTLLILLLALNLFVLLNPTMRATALYAAGLLCIMAASSSLIPSEDSALAVTVRVVGVGLMILSALQCSWSRHELEKSERRKGTRRLLLTSVLPIFFLIGAATIPHSRWDIFWPYAAGAFVLAMAVVATVSVSPTVLTNALMSALTLVVVGSLVAGLLSPSTGVEGGRLRGLFENANSLGYFAFLLGAVALLTSRDLKVKLLLLVPVTVVLGWTGSRAATLALAVVISLMILFRMRASQLIAAGLSFSVLLLAIRLSPELLVPFKTLLRANNSRELSWMTFLETLSNHPSFGIGMGQEVSFVASSPLRAAVVAGMVGLFLIALTYLGMLVFSSTYGAMTFTFASAAVVHSLFEGWLLSPISPLTLVYCVCWWVIASNELRSRSLLTGGQPIAAFKGHRRADVIYR